MNVKLFNVIAFIAALFFPRACLACGKRVREGALCAACRATITVSRVLYCGQCGAESTTLRQRLQGKDFYPSARNTGVRRIRNASCHPQFPYIFGAIGNYENRVMKALIHVLKFRRVRGAAEPLAVILVEYVLGLGISFKDMIVVPVPLSRKRFRNRGFNQSELIAKLFSELLELPLETRWLARVKHTKPQSETANLAERRENVRGCFAAAGAAAAAGAIHGKNIILIDDVSTSGATFLEAAQALKSAGAEEILALAVAKA